MFSYSLTGRNQLFASSSCKVNLFFFFSSCLFFARRAARRTLVTRWLRGGGGAVAGCSKWPLQFCMSWEYKNSITERLHPADEGIQRHTCSACEVIHKCSVLSLLFLSLWDVEDRRRWGQNTLRTAMLRTCNIENMRCWGQRCWGHATLRTCDVEDVMLRTCDVEEKQFFVRDHTETLQLTHILHSMLAAYIIIQYQMFVLNVACPQCRLSSTFHSHCSEGTVVWKHVSLHTFAKVISAIWNGNYLKGRLQFF